MNPIGRTFLVVVCLLGITGPAAAADGDQSHSREAEVIYGRKHGMALTMDVFTPEPRDRANGAAVVFMVSGGWYSHRAMIHLDFFQELLERGYTVFAVGHGSQPLFSVRQVVPDVHRAVRFIRHHADRFDIDPQRIGATGGSAGGHLSLMLGVGAMADAPLSDEAVNPFASGAGSDPVAQTASEVQAVACLYPPTDFLNYGEEGNIALGTGVLRDFNAPFDFRRFEGRREGYVLITDERERREIGERISPIYHISEDAAPTLIVHGDADELVPIQQAEIMIAALKEAGVEAELVVKEGGGHGWPDMAEDLDRMADWFDEHLE